MRKEEERVSRRGANEIRAKKYRGWVNEKRRNGKIWTEEKIR